MENTMNENLSLPDEVRDGGRGPEEEKKKKEDFLIHSAPSKKHTRI
jgi:hypothetical protein